MCICSYTVLGVRVLHVQMYNVEGVEHVANDMHWWSRLEHLSNSHNQGNGGSQTYVQLYADEVQVLCQQHQTAANDTRQRLQAEGADLHASFVQRLQDCQEDLRVHDLSPYARQAAHVASLESCQTASSPGSYKPLLLATLGSILQNTTQLSCYGPMLQLHN